MMNLPDSYQKLVATTQADDLRAACEIQDVPMKSPAEGEILVKTYYSGVNAADYLMALGRYLAPTPPPFDMGGESVGEVVAVGNNVDTLKVGDHILSIGDGGYREYFTTPAKRAIPIPQALPEVVALGVSGLTASIAMEKTANMSSGENVLVTAAAGGTGSIVVQLAKIAGNTVIGTCGSDEKVDFLQALGCDRPINYRKEDVKSVLKSEFPDGMDIVFESVGGEMFDTALKALAIHGRLVVIGSISEYEAGPQMVTGPRIGYSLLQKSASVRSFWLMHFFKYATEHMMRLLTLVNEGKLTLSADDSSFKGAAGALDALDYMYAGKNIGKVIVDFT